MTFPNLNVHLSERKTQIFLSHLTFRTFETILQCIYWALIVTYIRLYCWRIKWWLWICLVFNNKIFEYLNIWIFEWVKCVTRKIFELQTWEAARSGSSKPSTSFPPSHSKSWNKFSFEILKQVLIRNPEIDFSSNSNNDREIKVTHAWQLCRCCRPRVEVLEEESAPTEIQRFLRWSFIRFFSLLGLGNMNRSFYWTPMVISRGLRWSMKSDPKYDIRLIFTFWNLNPHL